MKRIAIFNLVVVTIVPLLSNSVLAYSTEEAEQVCKLPKILEFSLPEYSQPERKEVDPEAEFTFKISGMADPNKIQLSAKHQPLKFDLSSNSSFILVKGKLPAELTGKFVRLDVTVGTEIGCRSKDGWLLKVKG